MQSILLKINKKMGKMVIQKCVFFIDSRGKLHTLNQKTS